MPAERDVLALVARYPQAGAVKTRLAQCIGPEQSAALYSAFLRDLDERLAAGPWQTVWLHTPADAPFAAWLGPGRVSLPQEGSTLNDRLHQGFRRLLEQRPTSVRRVIIMSTDSPQLPLEWIERGFSLLARHDVVLGPCDDGGYYLIGMRAPHDVFQGVTMSTSRVLEETLALAQRQGLLTALLPPTFDVDDAQGLLALHRWLEANPAALRRTGRVMRQLALSPVAAPALAGSEGV
jgi:rSAM/selenodomain-associated transferase 1